MLVAGVLGEVGSAVISRAVVATLVVRVVLVMGTAAVPQLLELVAELFADGFVDPDPDPFFVEGCGVQHGLEASGSFEDLLQRADRDASSLTPAVKSWGRGRLW